MTPRTTDFSLYRRLLSEIGAYWPHVLGVLLLSLAATPLALLAPLPLKIAVDSVIGSQPLPGPLAAVPSSSTTALGVAAMLLVATAALGHLLDIAVSVLRTYTGERLVLGFRARLFRHAQRLSLAYHDARGVSDSAYRIQWDALAVQYLTIDGVIPFIAAGLSLTSMVYVTAQLDWQLALVAVAVSPVLFAVAHVYRRRLRGRSGAVKELESSAFSVVHEVLGAVRVVKAFGQEEREAQRFVSRSSESVRARLRLTFDEGGMGLLVGLTMAIGTAMVLFIGVHHVQSGALTLGELLLVMTYLAQLYEPLKTIGRKAASMQSHLASLERAFSLLDAAPDVVEQPHARRIAKASGAVAFRSVSFGYDPLHPVLDNVSFEIGPATRLGIAGTTGAGKTTLVSLLTRFYDPTAGQILLDGVDLREYRLADLRDQFAIVLQEPVLFSTSIGENIAYARPTASEHEIVEAARAAGVHDFVARLPRGYDTLVGERGMRLSGGERQRISLARAFLKNAPILILDEPTSSVDVRTESAIMQAMQRLMHGRTTIMIAHRLSTLDVCEARLQIEHGRLVTGAAVDGGREPTVVLAGGRSTGG